MRPDPNSTESVAVIGAGIIGCTVAWALAREGRPVLLLDPAEPAAGGASFGNAGHIATEQVQPLPSRQLLFNFWRELFAFDGPLDIPMRRWVALSPWISRFARAALHQKSNTRHLAPLVRIAAHSLQAALGEIGRADLIRRCGHYAVWFGHQAQSRAARGAHSAENLEVRTSVVPQEVLARVAHAAQEKRVAGLWFPESAHVLDPCETARAFANAAIQHGAIVHRASVRQLLPCGDRMEILTGTNRIEVKAAVVCAGAWSASLLAPFGVRAPLEAERGYHIELPGQVPLADGPLVYSDAKVVITPMAGRLRCSTYLEFAGLDAPPDPRKPARLRAKVRRLGYQCEAEGGSWMGPRPTLPDYLPGIGRVAGKPNLFYAVGHQHLGLTLAVPTAALICDLVAGRAPRFDLSGLDLRRFGASRTL